MPNANPLVIVGDEDVVSGFGALGFKAYSIKEAAEFIAIAEEIVQSNAAVCLVQDNIYAAAESEIDNYKSLALPVFIPFSKDAQTDLLDSITREIRLKATGAF